MVADSDHLYEFVLKKYVTKSDSLLLGIPNREELKIIQSSDSFDWDNGSGLYENLIVAKGLKTDRIKRLDNLLDVHTVRRGSFDRLDRAYSIHGELTGDQERYVYKDDRPSVKQLSLKMSVSFCHDDVCRDGMVDLRKYRIGVSERVIEYLDTKGSTNKSVSVQFYSRNPSKRGITIVYRMTMEAGRIANSRLYVSLGNRLKPLDTGRNFRLASFMSAVDYWHDNRLVESSAELTRIGTGTIEPEYMSLYS